jgi:integrase
MEELQMQAYQPTFALFPKQANTSVLSNENLGQVIKLFPDKNVTAPPKNARMSHSAPIAYSPYKSNGVKKAQRTESIASYTDLKLILDHIEQQGGKYKYRNKLMIVLGISTGLRISDLCQLRFYDVIEDCSYNNVLVFKQKITLIERKTRKLSSNAQDQCLITEAMQGALSEYICSLGNNFAMDDYLLKSQKPNAEGEYVLDEKSCHRVMKSIQKELHIPYNLGSHTFRRTFARLAYYLNQDLQMPSNNVMECVQMMLKHSSVRTTANYIGMTSDITNLMRQRISDFILGRTTMDKIGGTEWLVKETMLGLED